MYIKGVQPLIEAPVSSGRIKGLFFAPAKPDVKKPILVIFNQWRSGSRFIISKYLAEMTLKEGVYSGVLFLDRIASSGESDGRLSNEELKLMKSLGDFQFGRLYADALNIIVKELNWPKRYALAGSSGGAPAAMDCADAMDMTQRKAVEALILVELVGLKQHGIGKSGAGATAHALSKHMLAYRHRLRRGWWTPMDKEQYFHRKGKMFEYRAKWLAGDFVYGQLLKALAGPSFPPIRLILSNTSHIHSGVVRANLKTIIKKPHRYIDTTGNHDKICQPSSLSKLYSDYLPLKA